jgi:hypothetical protein
VTSIILERPLIDTIVINEVIDMLDVTVGIGVMIMGENETGHYRQGTQSPTCHEERLFKNIKLNAPTFDGCLNPRVFTQWTRDMDRFFNWYGVLENRRVQFTNLKLTGTAQLFWESVEDLLEMRNVPPVES